MIAVDDRELKSGICDELAKLNIEFEVCRLKVGDYIINSKIYIERKTVPDFIESLHDNRLFNQVHNLRKDSKRAIIIIEGTKLPGKSSVKGALCSLVSCIANKIKFDWSILDEESFWNLANIPCVC